jgi:transmembrane sensor
MSLTMPMPDDATLDEAAGWLLRLSDEAEAVDLDRLRAWLAADPSHARAMDLAEQTWSSLGDPVLWRRALNEAGRGRARRAPLVSVRTSAHPMRRAARWAAAAAALFGAVLLYRAESVGYERYEAAQGDRLDVQLADGSRLRLNGSTQVDVRLLWRKRELVLHTGEAEFEVAHESVRPFTVAAGRVVVRATGTDFAVRRDATVTTVLLVSGRVELHNAQSDAIEAVLEPWQKATYLPALPQGRKPEVRRVDPGDELAWRAGKIVFNSTNLGTALREFARYTPVTFRLAAPDLDALQVSGIYRVNDLQSFLDNLTRVFPLTWQRVSDNSVVIARRRP